MLQWRLAPALDQPASSPHTPSSGKRARRKRAHGLLDVSVERGHRIEGVAPFVVKRQRPLQPDRKIARQLREFEERGC